MPAGGSNIDAKTFNVGNAGRDFSTPDFDPSAEAAAAASAKQFGVWQVGRVGAIERWRLG